MYVSGFDEFDEKRLEKIIEEEKRKELEKASESVGIAESVEESIVEGGGEVPTYVEMFADVASKKLGIDRDALLRAFRDVVSSEDPVIKKLAKINKIYRMLSSLKRVGGITSSIADLSMARVASSLTSELENVVKSDEDGEMSSFIREMKRTMMQLMIMKEMSKIFSQFSMFEEPQNNSKGSGPDDNMAMLLQYLSSLEEKISRLEEKIRTETAEKTFFDKIKETIETSVSPAIKSIEDKMASLEAKIKELEEEKKKKEMEELIELFNKQVEELKKELEGIKKQAVLAVTGGGNQAVPVSLEDLFVEYKKKVEELENARKELDELLKKLSGGGGMIDERTKLELEHLRREIDELRRKADITGAIGDVIKNPDSVKRWIDTAFDILKKINELKGAVGSLAGGSKPSATEEVRPPEILSKILEEESKSGEGGEKVVEEEG